MDGHWSLHLHGKTLNAIIGGVGMLIGLWALKSLNSIDKLQPRMMIATFTGNPSAAIISFYSPTNVSEETDGDWWRHECSNW